MKTNQEEKMKWEIEWLGKKKPVIVNNLTWGKAVCKEREKVRGHTLNDKLHAELNMNKGSRTGAELKANANYDWKRANMENNNGQWVEK